MDSHEAVDQHHMHQSFASSSDDESYSQNPIKLESSDSIVPLTNILNELVQLKYFLLTGPAQLRTQDGIHRHTLPNKEQISCVVWKNVYFITGTDIVRCLSFRFEAFGREISNRKKFEEGIFSDLRNLKCDNDAVLEQPKSEFLDYLYRNNCVRTQKKQKIFYWFSVNHDRLFQDALERDLKKELSKKKSSTTPVRDPAISFQYDGSRTLHDQLPDIIEKFPRPLAELADASSIMSNLPIPPSHMMPQLPPQFAPNMPYQMMIPSDVPILVNQPPVLQSNGTAYYPSNQEVLVSQEGMIIPMQNYPQQQQHPTYYAMMPFHPQDQLPTTSIQQRPQPVPPSNEFVITDDQVIPQQIQQPIEDPRSDFPLDYVDPKSNPPNLPSQMFVEQNVDPAANSSTPDIPQGYYFDGQQYQDGISSGQIIPPNSYIQPLYTSDSNVGKPSGSAIDPAITYDNQQFQVVYHQDESGAYTSTMIPTSSNTAPSTLESNMPKELEEKESKPHSTPSYTEQDFSSQGLSESQQQRQIQQIRLKSSPAQRVSPYRSPGKPGKVKDEQIQRPPSAGSTSGPPPCIPSTLQARKLSSKISKNHLQNTNIKSSKTQSAAAAAAVAAAAAAVATAVAHDRLEYRSATYFMPTPSESGCSDVASFQHDHENSESQFASGGSFRGPINFRTGASPKSQGLQTAVVNRSSSLSSSSATSQPQLQGKSGGHTMNNTPDTSRDLEDDEKRSSNTTTTFFRQPARSEFDEMSRDPSNNSEVMYLGVSAEDGYIYGDNYVQQVVDDWI